MLVYRFDNSTKKLENYNSKLTMQKGSGKYGFAICDKSSKDHLTVTKTSNSTSVNLDEIPNACFAK